MKTILVYFLSFLTVFLILFCFNGVAVFDHFIICLAYCFCSIQITDSFDKIIPLKQDYDPNDATTQLNPELNHSNLEIRKHYRNIKDFDNLFSMYLCMTFFPIFLFCLVLQKSKFGSFFLELFYNNQFFLKYYKNKRKLLSKNIIIEDNKEYEISLFSDGREEYRHNGKLHREKGAAIHYDYETLGIISYIDNSQYYIEGKNIQQTDLEKEIKAYKMKYF